MNIPGLTNGFINFNRWAWSPLKRSGMQIGDSLGNQLDTGLKLTARSFTVGTAGAVAAFAAYKLGLLGATFAAPATVGFGFVAALGLVGGAALVDIMFKMFQNYGKA